MEAVEPSVLFTMLVLPVAGQSRLDAGLLCRVFRGRRARGGVELNQLAVFAGRVRHHPEVQQHRSLPEQEAERDQRQKERPGRDAEADRTGRAGAGSLGDSGSTGHHLKR
jgi:hypothetical protein